MIKKIIEKVFHTNEYTLTKIDKGLTNQNFLLRVNGKKYIVRIPYADSLHMISRKNEHHILQMVKNLDVPTIFFDAKSGIKITEYIDNLYEYKDCPYVNKIERCAHLIKQLHAIDAVDFHFDPIDTLHKYKQEVKQPLFPVSDYDFVIDRVRHLHHKKVLCHNDIVSGNILFGENRDYLIDYEYAASNDALFDVMSFISENNIISKEERERFYTIYFDEVTDTIRKELTLWEAFHNLLWCYWAMMLYESRKDSVYKEIAQDKYQALIDMHLKH